MTALSIHLLGTFQVSYVGKPAGGFRSERDRALLAYLAVERDRPHRREELMALLWPELDDGRARNNLRVNLHRLRKVLQKMTGQQEWLLVGRDAVQLNPAADVWLDVAAFEDHISAARRVAEERSPADLDRLRHLAEAGRLYRGEFLTGFSLAASAEFAQWASHSRERRHRMALQALYELCAMHIRRGELTQALSVARRQLELEPWREEAHQQVMEILARRGERSAALAQYQQCHQVLQEELGVEPAEKTQSLASRIEQLSLSRTHNLPTPAGHLIGRKTDLDQIITLLSDPGRRLLTLTGPGGSGKTRLAIAAADQLSPAFLDGVAYVPLIAVEDTEQVAPAIIGALGLPLVEATEPETQLGNFIRQRELLLVLDNCEHLLPALAGLLARLLDMLQVKLLATSREQLHVAGEINLTLGGLDLQENGPPATYGAGRLFLAQARRHRPNFDPDEQDARAIARICGLLDGMPLALELAAGWMNVVSPAEIAAEIEQNMALLRRPTADTERRHRSMELVFEQSWSRLSTPERQILDRLSIFVGPFDRLAAQNVAGASLTILSGLISKSLVQREEVAAGRATHYVLHPLMRRFAADKLNQNPAARQEVETAFVDYFSRFLAERTPLLLGPDHSRAIAEILSVFDNARAALRTAGRLGDVQAIGRSLLPVLGTTFMSSVPFASAKKLFGEMAEAVERVMASKERETVEDQAVLARALAYYTWFCLYAEGESLAQRQAERALLLAENSGDQEIKASILNMLGILARRRGDFGTAEQLFKEALQVIEPPTYRYAWWQQGSFYTQLGATSRKQNKFAEAKAHFVSARRAFRRAESALGLSLTTRNLGDVYLKELDYQAARTHYEEALGTARELSAQIYEAQALIRLARLALRMDQGERANELLAQAASLGEALGSTTVLEAVQDSLQTETD